MQYILFDDNTRYSLLPFTHTRPAADIRCGILTMRERWEKYLSASTSTLTENYLQAVFPLTAGDDNVLVNGRIFATAALCTAVQQLGMGQKLVKGEVLIAARTSHKDLDFNKLLPHNFDEVHYAGDVHELQRPWDIFTHNERALKEDFKFITVNRESAAVPGGVTVTGNELFIEEGAVLNAGCIINTQTGPVYIGKNAQVLEGTLIRGALAVCEDAVVKMGAKVYGATTIGPGCKVGGELNNIIMFANSNKGHDGYLGNAVIGEWCNLGADTNCSNLKNNYDCVKVWDEHNKKSTDTGLTFCGLLMGDHSKSGINTMFNTGTIAGVSCNIFGGNYQEKFIPSFTWGGDDNIVAYDLNRAMETAGRMMARRGKELSAAEREMYRHIYEQTAEQRNWFAKKQ